MWQSLYLSCVEDITDTLHTLLNDQGYTLYDPFGLIPGPAYPHTVKLFIAPPRAGWTRLIADSVPPQISAGLSKLGLCIDARLDGETAQVTAYEHGQPVDHPCLQATPDGDPDSAQKGDDAFPLDMLPDDVQRMAENLNPRQVNKMFNRLMKRINRRVDGDPNAARDMLRRPAAWDSPGGRQMMAVLACLQIPDWREPDFVTLRDAYALHKRGAKTLLPGDAEAMQAVPDALDYIPVYGGQHDGA